MRLLFTLAMFIAIITSSYSQLDDGATAPDFTLDDIDGVTHTLYDYLDDEMGVLIDFSATWCGLCWNYHTTGTLENVWNQYGPSGSDEVMVFFIEPDPGTSENCIYGASGCSGGSIGDWTAGVSHPIFSPNSADATAISSDYDIGSFPTLYAIGPNYKAYDVGKLTVPEWEDWIESFTLEADYSIVPSDGCSLLDVEIDASGGYGSLQYIWSNGETGSLVEEIQPGTYTVEVKDANGYSIEVGPIVIVPGAGISIELDEIEDVSCFDELDGYLEVSGENGSGNFTYSWDNGVNTYFNDDLGSGDYTVLITDLSSGCTAEETYTILDADFFGAEVDVLSANCEGQNGTLEIDVDGGVGSLIYFVNGVPYNEPTIEDLEVGIYTIVVRDAANCTVNLSAEIDQPIIPLVDTLMPDIITCSQQLISLSADSSSIGDHIIYTWNLDTLAIDTGYVIQTDTFGLFTLVVKDTLSTCFDSLTFTVATDTLAPALTVSADDNVLTCDLTSTTLNGTTEMDNVILNWTSGSNVIIGIEETLDVSSPGTYTLDVIDIINGCVTTDSLVITENLETPMIVLDQISDIDCQNTTATVSIQDDQQSTYLWATDGGSISGNNSEAAILVESPGDYTVTSTNLITGCTSEETYTVASSTDLPEVTLSQPDLLTCDQESTLLQANDEVGYSYEWSDEQGNIISQDAEYETDLPGIFSLRVTDNSNGCSQLNTVTVNQDIEAPEIVLEGKGDLSCSNLEASISVEEMTDHSYEWTSNNGVIVSGNLTNEVRVSEAGNYKLLLTNNMTGCTAQKNYNVTENITIPEVDIVGVDLLTCDVSQITLVADADDSFTYEWTTNDGSTVGSSSQATLQVNASGTYQLVTTNIENGCISTQSITIEEDQEAPVIEVLQVGTVDCSGGNALITLAANTNIDYEWSTQEGSIIGNTTSASLEVDQAGFYEVTATDQINGCSTTETIEVLFSQAPPIVEVSGDLLICKGGNTTLCMTTSDGDTQWFIDGNLIGSDQCIEVNQAIIVEAVSTNSIGCSTSSVVSVEEYVFPDYNTTGGQQVLDCVTSSVQLGYQIDQEQDFSPLWSDALGIVIGETTTVGITTPGMYTLTLVNLSTGCEESTTLEVMLDETAVPTAVMTAEGDLTQQFGYTAEEDVDSQVWTFGDGAMSTEPNPTYTYVIPGLYEVCLTLNNKCGGSTECNQLVAAFPISISDQLSSDLDCYGDEDGSISLSLSDGVAPYSVEWTGPNGYTSEGQEIMGLEAGDYQAVITDAGNTDEILEFTINQPDEIVISAELIQEETLGQANGSISLIVLGGTGTLSYSWSHGPTTGSVSGLEAGEYTVSIMDQNGCEIIKEYTVGIVSSVSDIDGLDLFEASPNPTSGLLTITVEMKERKDLQFSLMDISGKIYRSSTLSQSSETLQLDLSDLTQGLYLIRLTNGNQVSTRRVVVMK